MGFCYWEAKQLWEARFRGVSFRDTLTIGHQSLSLHRSELKFFRSEYESAFPGARDKTLDNYSFGDYSDAFLRQFVGVESLSVMDYSPYEGADVIHDLNTPVPKDLEGRFDAVIDAGSLEHIFNFPVAIANLMKMVKVGGSIFIATPANNLCGHGFYQFSPELMFRIFTKENGFELKRILMYEAVYPGIEQTVNRRAYQVADPDDVRCRVGLISAGPVTLLLEAVKTTDVQPFVNPPLQSDYVTAWNEDRTARPDSDTLGIKKRILSKFPGGLQILVRRLKAAARVRIKRFTEKKSYSFSNKRFYRRL